MYKSLFKQAIEAATEYKVRVHGPENPIAVRARLTIITRRLPNSSKHCNVELVTWHDDVELLAFYDLLPRNLCKSEFIHACNTFTDLKNLLTSRALWRQQLSVCILLVYETL